MRTQLLSDELKNLFEEVGRLAERHHEALAYVAASERTAFLQLQMQSLRQMLSELRIAAALVRSISGDRSGEELWRQTCADLRSRAPTDLLAPGHTLVAGGLDLLRLVDYTGASTALVRERRDRLVSQAAQGLMRRQRAVASPMVISSDPSEAMRLIHQAIVRISESDGALQVDDVVQEQGWAG